MKFSCAMTEALIMIDPIGRDWKEYWREREKNPLTRKQVRQEKREVRCRLHRETRRRVKEALRVYCN